MHHEGACLVLAGPGSGKTAVIVNRLQNLLTRFSVKPEKILVITFTKAAALQMQERFYKIMDGKPYPVKFGTFHAIFYYILRQSKSNLPRQIITESEKYKLVEKIYISFSQQFQDVVLPPVEDMIKCIGKYKNTGERIECLPEPHLLEKEYFLWIYAAYDRLISKEEKLDFDDMAKQCLQLFRQNSEVLHFWQEQFTYLLIDEFQDINESQYEVIRMLAGERKNLFVVGDDDQSIYGFRGASPDIMTSFQRDYPESRRIFLSVNYRSDAAIVEAAGKVIAENKKRVPKDIRAANINTAGSNGQTMAVNLKELPDRETEENYIVERLKAWKKKGRQYEEAAIICRTNFELEAYALLLKKYKIPFQRREKKKSLFEHFIMQDLEAYLRIAAGERKRCLFLRIINHPMRHIGRDFFTNEVTDFAELKKKCANNHGERDDKKRKQIEKLEQDCRKLSTMPPFLAIHYIRMGIGYDAYWKERAGNSLERLEEFEHIMEFLQDHAKNYRKTEEWLKAVEQLRKIQVESTEEGKKGVSLVTMHGSKGLEYGCVWIPDINEGVIPGGRMLTEEALEEERRMFYVAMTRAKEQLEMYYVKSHKGRKKLPSRFLIPFGEQLT